MEDTSHRAVAVVGVGAIMPDAPNAPAFWENVTKGVYSISEVDPKRWDPALYYDPDPKAPRKTYSKIGGWVRDFPWEPVKWKLPIPPRVEAAMDEGQKWAIALTRETLADYGWPSRPLDLDRTAVILGNAMGGEKHYQTSPPHRRSPSSRPELAATSHFAALPPAERARRPRRAPPGHRPAPPRHHRGHDAGRALATASPGGSRTSSTSTAPTTSPTRPAPPRSRR